MNKFELIEDIIDEITVDINTGFVYGKRGNKICSRDGGGYLYYKYRYDGKYYNIKLHHIIYYVNNGIWDESLVIDHIDGDRCNNSISNLRLISIQSNSHNRKDVKGAHFRKDRNKWYSLIIKDTKRIYLGYFDTEQEAHQTYLNAKKIYHII